MVQSNARRRVIDLSHPIGVGMPSYPGLPEPAVAVWLSHEESGRRGAYAPGTTFQIATYALGGNTGTYVDAPFHRHPDGPDLAGVPLEHLADLLGVVVDAPAEGPLEASALEGVPLAGRAVLVRTGWDRHWGTPRYFTSGPFLPAATCERLVAGGAALVGIDCANVDDVADRTRPAHTTLLAAGIPIVEHLRGLDALPREGFRFTAAPPAIAGGTSFPVRAFAVVDGGA